jgi:hypothetical protein
MMIEATGHKGIVDSDTTKTVAKNLLAGM